MDGMEHPTITAATDADMRELYELQLLAFESEAEMIGSRSVPALTESWEHFRDDFQSWTVLVIREEGRILAAARYRLCNGFVDVGRLMVHPDRRNRGWAMALLLAIEEQVCPALLELYTCTKSYINIRLYTKLGYAPCKEEQGADGLSFVYMHKQV